MIKNKWKKQASKPTLVHKIKGLQQDLKNMKERAETYVKVAELKARDYKEQFKRLKVENETLKKELAKLAIECGKLMSKKPKKKKKVKKK